MTEGIGRITAWYGVRDGGFWIALQEEKVVGMFGLEGAAPNAMELRRIYVDPSARRGGIARSMLRFAETECRRLGARRRELSTSELQPAALELYRRAGFQVLREEVADQVSNRRWEAGFAVTTSRTNV